MGHEWKQFFEFGSFRIDADERRLLNDNREVPLTPKVFDLLLFLVQNNRHTLTKDDLIGRLWGDTIVEENSLTRNISTLRKTLQDNGGASNWIRTVPKRGYRFESDVRVVVEDEEELLVERRTNYRISIGNDQYTESGENAPRTISRLRPAALLATVAFAVVLGLVLTGWIGGTGEMQEQAPGSKTNVNPEADELFRKGRELWRNRSAAGLHEAALLLEQAVERAPDHALAHAALADAYAFDGGNWPRAEDMARRTIELDAGLGEPYATIGFVELFWKWDLVGAETNFRQAIALSPEYATAHQWYSLSLMIAGRFNEALAEMDRAVELEPNSVAINTDRCLLLYTIQQLDEAEVQCKRALELDPHSFYAYTHLSDIYADKGMYPETVDAFLQSELKAVNVSTLPTQFDDLLLSFEKDGITGFWQMRIEMIGGSDWGAYLAAKYQARLGNAEKALDDLERSYELHEFGFPFFYTDPVFVRCCSDQPRFHQLWNRWLSDQGAADAIKNKDGGGGGN